MNVADLQEPPEVDCAYLNEMIKKVRYQFDTGITDEIKFHQQLALFCSMKKDAFLTRHHAAMVPDTAGQHEVAETKVSLAQILVYERDIPAAIEAYQAALVADPEHDTAHEELGYCLLEIKQFEEAIPHFDFILNEEDAYTWVWEVKGKALVELGRFAEALPCFKNALEYAPQGGKHHVELYFIGLCYQHLNDNYRAMAHYSKALELCPDFPEALNNVGALYFNDDEDLYDIKTAIEYFKHAEAIADINDDDRFKAWFI